MPFKRFLTIPKTPKRGFFFQHWEKLIFYSIELNVLIISDFRVIVFDGTGIALREEARNG